MLYLPVGVSKVLGVMFGEYSITIAGDDNFVYVLADQTAISSYVLC